MADAFGSIAGKRLLRAVRKLVIICSAVNLIEKAVSIRASGSSKERIIFKRASLKSEALVQVSSVGALTCSSAKATRKSTRTPITMNKHSEMSVPSLI
jgi:hypothetical protein